MRSTNLRKCLITLMTGGFLLGEVSCLPNRDQINSMVSSSILSGIGLAITFTLQEMLTPEGIETPNINVTPDVTETAA